MGYELPGKGSGRQSEQDTFKGTDIRTWLPGDGWTAPGWIPTTDWPVNYPDLNWINEPPGWSIPPQTYEAADDFRITAPPGHYILALAVLDPAGMLPSPRFAANQYINGERHPLGIVAVVEKGSKEEGGPLREGFLFDDPALDDSLHYIP